MVRGNLASLQSSKPMGEIALARSPLSVKLEPAVDAAIRALPAIERSVWMRRVLTEAAEREGLLDQPVV